MNLTEIESAPKEIDQGEFRPIVHFCSHVVLFFGVLILLATAFSFPFPFMRKVWVREVWGYYGILNSFFFVLISRSMKRFFFPAISIGIGVVFFEAVMTGRGLFYLYQHNLMDFSAIAFALGSLIVMLILLAACVMAGRAIWKYRSGKQSQRFPVHPLGARLMLVLLYALFSYLMMSLGRFNEEEQYSAMRLLAYGVSISVFYGVGFEMDFSLRKRQIQPLSVAMIAVHVIFYFCLLWQAFHRMSLAQILVKGG